MFAAVFKARQALGPDSTMDEALEKAKCPRELWDQIATARLTAIPLDSVGPDSDNDARSFHESIADPASLEDPIDNRQERDEMRLAVMDSLAFVNNTNAQFVLKAHYGLCGMEPKNLKQIGDQLGISRERARQLKEIGLNQLRLQARRDQRLQVA
jgi:RNA polymerase primary sigma factor